VKYLNWLLLLKAKTNTIRARIMSQSSLYDSFPATDSTR